jgi:hypothetical protein
MQRLQALLELAVILDDAVVHDGDRLVGAEMWVRVGVVRLTVGSPTGVSNADVGDTVHGLSGRAKVGHLPSLLHNRHTFLAGANETNASGVVTTA